MAMRKRALLAVVLLLLLAGAAIGETPCIVKDSEVLLLRAFVDSSYGDLLRLDPDTLWGWGVAAE